MATTRKSRSKVGVIGLGIIGTRVAANLRSAGHQVYVWSRTPRAAPNFLGSVVEVADLCDVIQLFISDDGALEEVIRTVAAALRPRHVVLCHATVSPEATRRAAGIVESQGARYLDAPFTGSKSAAQNKQLVYYIGGAKPALEEVRAVLEATSKAVLHVGGVGDASVLKIATNMLTASTVQTLAEALALVRAAGIDASKLVEALENNASRSGTSDLKLPAMIAGNTEANFSLKHMLKDVRFAQKLADKYELSLPLTDTTAEVFELGIQNDWGDDDFSVVAQLYPAPAAPAPPTAKPATSPVSAPAPAKLASPPAPASAPAAQTAPKSDTKLADVSAKPVVVPKADEKPADAAPKPPAALPATAKAPEAIGTAEKPPLTPPAAPNPAESPAKPVVELPVEAKLVSNKELPAGVVLPPRPGGDIKPNNKALVPAPAMLADKLTPAEKDDESVFVPLDAPKKPAAEQTTQPVPIGSADAKNPLPKPTPLKPMEPPATDSGADAKREKKSTLQSIRGFFKAASTDKR